MVTSVLRNVICSQMWPENNGSTPRHKHLKKKKKKGLNGFPVYIFPELENWSLEPFLTYPLLGQMKPVWLLKSTHPGGMNIRAKLRSCNSAYQWTENCIRSEIFPIMTRTRIFPIRLGPRSVCVCYVVACEAKPFCLCTYIYALYFPFSFGAFLCTQQECTWDELWKLLGNM